MTQYFTNMSLDTLFRQIILTELHVSVNCRQLLEAKSAIATYSEQVKTHREQLKCLEDELHQEGLFLSEMILQYDLLKKKREHLENRSDELQQHQQRLRDDQETQKNWDVEQQKKFMAETKAFNCDYCLLRHRHTIVYRQASAEMLRLMQEAAILSKEMQCMTQTNAHMNLKQEKKTVLQSHLTQLEIQHGELESEAEEAASLTSSLKVERATVTKKPALDKLCLRLKDEVGIFKEGNLELKHQMLSATIQLLQKKLSQKI
ncbi:coiled-coil domain-containing protein 172 isoform X2 [Sardina pilchardus]|uniref:coiled-coil domain-containing protein 172 isoform X2 n=1 Tax=Sardina pilchardus TaxID=27697 RepID=UPI002E111724